MNSKKINKLIIGPYDYEWEPEIPLAELEPGEQFTVCFEDTQTIVIEKQDDGEWILVNAYNGYGINNFEEFSIYDLQIIEGKDGSIKL